MINSFNIAKALLDNTQSISDANSYLLIPDGESFTPNPNDTYIEEFALYGPDVPIGLEDSSSDIQIGIYQLNINTPKAEVGSRWAGLAIEGVLRAGFARGTELTFGGQMVRIRDSSITQMEPSDTHETHILNITYSVIN